MLATFFEWQIKPGQHDVFVKAWAEVTEQLKAHGSFGSCLFTKQDGTICALARWPDQSTRDAAFATIRAVDGPAKIMRGVIAETIQQFDMEEVVNLWTQPPAS
jgi:hypothetical protein